MPKFNLEQALLDQGMQLKEVQDDGRINVADPSGQERVINVNRIIADMGKDPSKVEVVYNSPDTALDSNPIGFKTGVKMATARRAEDQLKILQEEYGENNVMSDGDTGFLIKDKGVWKKGSPSFMQEFAADSPVTAAGMAGFVKGAGWGTALGGPILGFLGGVLGGAASATIARYGQIVAAEKLGIRTEEDAQMMKEELGREFVTSAVFDTVLPVVGKVAKIAGKGVMRAVDPLVNKEMLAATLAQVMPGTKAVDWQTLIKNNESADLTMKAMQKKIIHSTAAAKGEAVDAVDPVMKEMLDTTGKALGVFKKLAQRNYNQAIDLVENNPAVSKKPIDITPMANDFTSALQGMGLLKNGKFLGANEAVPDNIRQVFDEKSLASLRKQYDQLMNQTNSSQMSFGQIKQMVSGLDDILESTGFYNTGDLGITKNARIPLAQLRSRMRASLANSIGEEKVMFKGQQIAARELFNKANIDYSKFRNVWDDYAVQMGKGVDTKRAFNTIQRMIGENGELLEQQFSNIAASVGKNADPVLNKLKALRAGRNLSAPFDPSVTGLGSVVKRTVIGGPRDIAPQIASYGKAMNKGAKVGNWSRQMTEITGMAHGIQMFKKLLPAERLKILNNPELLNAFMAPMLGAGDLQDEMRTRMIGQ